MQPQCVDGQRACSRQLPLLNSAARGTTSFHEFPRHERSIVRWGHMAVRNGCRSAQTLTVSMSRSRLFLGELRAELASASPADLIFTPSVGAVNRRFQRDA